MAKETEIVCIMCPLACRVLVTADDAGNILDVAHYECKEGREYAIVEYKFPARVLTTTLLTAAASRRLLPVRSSQPIPKTKLMGVMYSLGKIRIGPPVKMGQVVVPNINGTGADMISTDELLD